MGWHLRAKLQYRGDVRVREFSVIVFGQRGQVGGLHF